MNLLRAIMILTLCASSGAAAEGGLKDLPLVEVSAKTSSSDTLAVLLSGGRRLGPD